MAVNWGPARESSTNGARVGIELAVSGSGSTRTVTFEIWLWTKRASYGSSASYSYSGTFQGSGSGTFSYNHTNNSRDWPTQNRTRIARWTKTWTLQYGQTITITAGASVSGLGGNIPQPVSHSRSVTLPARPYNPPATPGSPSVTRSSDSAQVIKWTNRGTTSAPVTRTRIRRRYYNGNPRGSYTSYIDRGTSTGTSFTDSTVGNWWYEYAIRAEGPGGNSAWVYLPGINTTPGSPKNVRVTPRSDGNLITWEPGHRWITGITMEVQRQEGSGSWTSLAFGLHAEDTATLHPDPNLAVTHRYRVRAVSSHPTLYSSWSYSDTVQLSAPPAAPTGLGPSSPWDATEARELTWSHVPTDGSQQTAYQIQHRLRGTSTWTTLTRVDSSESRYTLPAGTYSNGDEIEWRVRTWGVHPDPGPYSSINIQRPEARPTVSINSPEHGVTIDNSSVELSWGYDQAQGSQQASWRWELRDEDTGRVVRSDSGTGSTTSRTLHGLQDETTYTVSVEVRSAHGLWSEPDEATFSVSYLPPSPPSLEAEWDVEHGAAALQLTQSAWTEEHAEPSHHQVWRAADRHTSRAWFALQDALRSREERDLAEPRVNLVKNPRGRNTDGTVVVAENLLPDPRARQTGSWDATGRVRPENSGSLDFVDDGIVVTYGYGYEDGSIYYVPSIPIPSGASRFHASARVTNLHGYAGLRIRFQFYDGDNNLIESVDSVDLQTSTQGSRLGADAAIPAGAQSVRVYWYGAYATPGEQQHFAEFYCGVVGYPWFFDGDTSPDPDLTPEWTGTPGESASRLVAPKPVGWEAQSLGKVFYSQTHDAVGMLLEPLPDGGEYERGVLVATYDVGTALGEHTSVFQVWTDTGNSLYDSVNGGELLSGGTYRRPGSPQLPYAFILSAASKVGVPVNTLYIRAGAVLGEYDGPYFDGHMEDTDDTTYEWEDEPDNSASVATDIAVPRLQDDFDDAWRNAAVLLVDNVELDTATTDPIPIIGDGTVNLYMPVTVSVLPSIAEGEIVALEVPHRDTRGWVYLNTGPDMSQVCRVKANAKRSGTRGNERELEHYFGRKKPVEYSGEIETNTWDVSARIWPAYDGESSEEELVELQQTDGPVCYRDPWGKRWFASMSPIQDSFEGNRGEVSWTMTEVDYREGLARLEDADD